MKRSGGASRSTSTSSPPRTTGATATSPSSSAASIVQSIGAHGLRGETGWARIVVEKPFGRDRESARKLNEIVQTVFREDEVFRIDHYLGKETVQNILVFRFANTLFEPL